jgi:hypothetical protein
MAQIVSRSQSYPAKVVESDGKPVMTYNYMP